jgi:trans-aconitate methyltransferase
MTFEFDGKKYEKASAHQKEWGNNIISEFNLSGNEKILDLGCGNGALTAELAKLVPNGMVLGIDASQGMLKAANEKELPNLTFQLMDINNLNLSEKFDIIFSNATLHWVTDHNRLWCNIKNIISENALIRFNFAADGNCSTFFKVIKQAMVFEEFKKYFSKFVWPWYMPSIDEYKSLLSSFSFSETKVWEENKDRYFPDKDTIVGWINQPSIVPFLKNIEEAKKERFRNHVIEQMLEETKQVDGTYFETFRRINVFIKN